MQISVIYFGLFYQVGKEDSFTDSDGIMYLIFSFILIITSMFVTVFFLRIRLEMLKATVTNYICCFRMLSCCRIKDLEAFKKDNKVNLLHANEILQSVLTSTPKPKEQLSEGEEIDDSVPIDPAQIKIKMNDSKSFAKKVDSEESVDDLDISQMLDYSTNFN